MVGLAASTIVAAEEDSQTVHSLLVLVVDRGRQGDAWNGT